MSLDRPDLVQGEGQPDGGIEQGKENLRQNPEIFPIELLYQDDFYGLRSIGWKAPLPVSRERGRRKSAVGLIAPKEPCRRRVPAFWNPNIRRFLTGAVPPKEGGKI